MLNIRNQQMKVLDDSVRERLGREVIQGLEASTPHAVQGLAPAEVDARLETALRKADVHQLRAIRDLRAFIRLCFIVGPRFADYPPVQTLLQTTKHLRSRRLEPLFEGMLRHGWQRAADYDIVTRARDPVPPGSWAARGAFPTQGTPAPSVHPVSLEPLATSHARAYFHHALHPDVWRLGRMQPQTSMEKTLDAIRSASAGDNRQAYAILDAEAGFIGAIMLDGTPPLATVAYWVARPYWGHGAGTSAIGKLLVRLRMQNRVTKLRADVARTNRLSVRLVERMGWTEVTPVHDLNSDRAYEVDI